MNQKLLKKYVLSGIMSVFMIMTLTACSASEAKNGAKENPTSTEVIEQTVQEETPEVQEPIQESVEVATEEVVEEPTEETTPEEPQVEMVDFETWAKQEDNDEVCLVVWNEELGVQEIMPTVEETKKAYETQDGDKFAIPYRESIIYIGIDDESQMWSNTEYLEVAVVKGERCTVTIAFENEEGELETINYMFK